MMKTRSRSVAGLCLATLCALPGCGSNDAPSEQAPPATVADASDAPEGASEAAGQDAAQGDAVEAGDAAAPDSPSADAPSETGPAGLEIGEVREIAPSPDKTISAQIPTPLGTESFIAVIFSAAWETNQQLSYQIGLTPPPSSIAPPAHPKPARTRLLSPPNPMLRWRGARSSGPRVPVLPVPPPAVGEHRKFKVMDAAFQNVLEIDGECVKAGSSLAVWLDRTTQTPKPAAIDAAKLDPIVEGFAGTVLPRHRVFFGQESDIDQDGLVHILFTPIFATTGVVAYVSPCDLSANPGCPAHNDMELIYATPPDQIGSPMMASISSILETAAHEFQHDIYFYRKFMLNKQPTEVENPYVTEATSGLAEDLSGYGNGTFYVWASALESMADVSGPDLLDSSLFGYDQLRDGTLRGAGYLLVRYLYEQAGGNVFEAGNKVTDKGGVAWLRAFVDAKEIGQANVEKRTGRTIGDVLFDWYTALAVSNRKRPGGGALSTDPRYNYQPVTWDPDTKSSTNKPERHGVDLFADNPMTGTPLSGPTITDVSQADKTIRAGGVEYLRIAASGAGGSVGLMLKGEVGAALRLRIVREK